MESNRIHRRARNCRCAKVSYFASFVTYRTLNGVFSRHNTTISLVLLDGNGLTRELIDSIRVICDRNGLNREVQEKSKLQTSFLLQELENTKSMALEDSCRLVNEIDISRHEKVKLEANLWANKSMYLLVYFIF